MIATPAARTTTPTPWPSKAPDPNPAGQPLMPARLPDITPVPRPEHQRPGTRPAVRAREPQITAGRRVHIHRCQAQPYDGHGRHRLGSLLAAGATRAFPIPRMCRQRLRGPAPRRPAAPSDGTPRSSPSSQPVLCLNAAVRRIAPAGYGGDHHPRPGRRCPVPVCQADAVPDLVHPPGLGQGSGPQLRLCQPEDVEPRAGHELVRIQPGPLAHPSDPFTAVRLRNMPHSHSLASGCLSRKSAGSPTKRGARARHSRGKPSRVRTRRSVPRRSSARSPAVAASLVPAAASPDPPPSLMSPVSRRVLRRLRNRQQQPLRRHQRPRAAD